MFEIELRGKFATSRFGKSYGHQRVAEASTGAHRTLALNHTEGAYTIKNIIKM